MREGEETPDRGGKSLEGETREGGEEVMRAGEETPDRGGRGGRMLGIEKGEGRGGGEDLMAT
jgi:hypothetical protein